MRQKDKPNRELPPRMIKQTRRRKSGKIWVDYYNSHRKEIPLGSGLNEARAE